MRDPNERRLLCGDRDDKVATPHDSLSKTIFRAESLGLVELYDLF
jgi:hypothetical protein